MLKKTKHGSQFLFTIIRQTRFNAIHITLNVDYNDVYYRISQRERLRAEIEYMEKLRGIKRRREVLPHRAQLDLLMGGKRVDLTERLVHVCRIPVILCTPL